MKNLITGGTGSIGREIVFQLLRAEEEVLCFDRNEEKAFYLEQEIKNKFPDAKFTICLGSITDYKRLYQVCQSYKPDVIYHTAANKHVPLGENNIKEFVKNNISGTLNVMGAAMTFSSKLVFISTDKAVQPVSVMGYTKRMCELAILSTGMNAVICRFGNVEGSSGSVIRLFEEQAKTGILKVTHIDMERYFISVNEAVSRLIKCSKLPAGLYGFNMGKPVKINDLAKCFALPIEYIGLRPGEKIKESLVYPDEVELTIFQEGFDNIYTIVYPKVDALLVVEITNFAQEAEYLTNEEILNRLKKLNNEF
jgi:FlaA1/EpsC-like NDP-sugar epimerase